MTKICSVLLLTLGLCRIAHTQAVDAGSFYLREATVTETAGKVKITANSPRPLEQMLDALQRKYGWIVNYEDPEYHSTADLKKGRDEHSQVPAGGEFKFEFTATSIDEENILRRMIDAYNASGNPGYFELRHAADDTFDVVGVGTRNAKGDIIRQQAPFDTPVTFASREDSIDETLNRICRETAKRINVDLTLAISPRKVLLGHKVAIKGSKIAARELLAESLLAAREKIYWRLLFDPTSNGYYLDLHLAHS